MKNNIRYKGNTNNASVIFFFNRKPTQQKLPAMVLCLGEPPGRFLLFLFIHFRSSFCCCCSSFHFQATLPCHRHSTLASQARKGLHQLWALPWLLLIAFAFSSIASAIVLVETFLPTCVFYLTLLHQHFRLNLRLSRPPWEPAVIPWSLQGFILTSYWSLKHRPAPSVSSIHSNPQSWYSEEFIFKFYHILSWITCGQKFSSYAPYSFRTLFTCSKSYVETIKNPLNKTRLVLLITASMNIKVILKKQPSVIENNRCLTDTRYF